MEETSYSFPSLTIGAINFLNSRQALFYVYEIIELLHCQN